MSELTMPSLGADMTAGRLIEWHVAPGDAVHRGDIVATVDTDKSEIDIETFDDGVVDELLVTPGTKVPVGAVLATIRADSAGAAAHADAGADAGATVCTDGQGLDMDAHGPVGAPVAAAPAPAPPAPAPAPAAPAPVTPAPAAAAEPHRPRISPLARRVAADLGVDVDALTGTGPGGAVTRVDVERAAHAAEPPPEPHPAELEPHATEPPPHAAEPPPHAAAPPAAAHRSADERLAGLRAAVGELMARSKREIPHFTVQRTIDMTAALDALAEHNAGRPPQERILPAALLLRAAARAVHDVPVVNGTWEDGAFHQAEHVTLGVAVSLRRGGVIAPAIARADELSPAELMAALHGITGRVRRGVLRGTDMAPASLTVTSLGEHGADLVDGVIFWPQVGLVGFGRIAWRPWAGDDGLIGARRTVIATFAGDHRVSEGHSGSLYLEAIDHELQEPFAP